MLKLFNLECGGKPIISDSLLLIHGEVVRLHLEHIRGLDEKLKL